MSGLDTTAKPDCYSGQAVLCLKRISPITNRSEEANQTAVPENFMSMPDSVLFGHCALGVGAGIWERTKGLLNHHIAAAIERHISLFPV